MLLKNHPFILRVPQDERVIARNHWEFFPFMLSLVEAFLGFFRESKTEIRRAQYLIRESEVFNRPQMSIECRRMSRQQFFEALVEDLR